MQADLKELKIAVTSQYRLNPVTSLNTSRYECSGCVQLSPRVIGRGPALRARSSSVSKWRPLIHPEGKSYSVLTGEFAFDIVTEANIEDQRTQCRIFECITMANDELHRNEIKLSSRCELLLELTEDGVCNYYFVDHVGKKLFWLEDLCTEFLDIPASASDSHLDTEMERLYWVHVEYFPMHHDAYEHLFREIVDDLYNVVSHGQADRLTSKTSTFPYTADTCKQFLKLLSRKRGQRVDGYTLCYAARLAGAIARQRFTTFYGQQHAQLDRLQEMFPADVIQHTRLSTVANLLMWGIPLHYTSLLDDLYLNEEVYADQWTRFMSICLADWTASLSWSFAVFIASVLLANVHGGSVSTSIPPVLSCAVSIASASCLHLRHQPLAESSAAVGARYLYLAKSRTVGFLASSVAFSLPRASYLWGLGLLTAQFVFIVSQSVSRLVALVAASVVGAIMLFVTCVIQPECASVTSLVQTFMSSCNLRLYLVDARQDEQMV